MDVPDAFARLCLLWWMDQIALMAWLLWNPTVAVVHGAGNHLFSRGQEVIRANLGNFGLNLSLRSH